VSTDKGRGAAQSHLKQAVALHQAGRLTDARTVYLQVLEFQPGNADALHLLGVIESQTGDHVRALDLINRAIAIRSRDPAFLCNRGNALKALGRLDEALADYARAIKLKPDFAAAHGNRANALKLLGRLDEALASQNRLVGLSPRSAEAWNSRGNTLKELGRLDEALESYERALSLQPGYSSALSNRGVVLHELRRLDEAIASYDQALKLTPGAADTWSNRGLTQLRLGRMDDALASFDQAILLNEDYAKAHSHRGLTLQQLDRLDEAVASYGRAVQLSPDDDFLYGTWLHARMKLCDWDGLDAQIGDLIARVERGLPVTPPFAVLAMSDRAAVQRRAAEITVVAKHPEHMVVSAPIATPFPDAKIRIGYFSADYHDHATAYLVAELFEQHDRDRFELVAFSFGPDCDDPMRRRISSAFDRFLDVREQSDRDIASLSRSLNIDIAVDLKGFTQGHRMGIFAHRAAPVQVSYLGYPGTVGAPYMDYLIADATLIPPPCARHYSENIVWLPDTYQVNDRKRTIADHEYSRSELGLPDRGFVFCCFNNHFKITPATFDGWMLILRRVEGSVLWLFEDNPVAARHLQDEAGARGIDPARLVFAQRLPLPEHLARHRAADLFLDTLPCNAHTTASDALWAGLPVLTLTGEALASRVAASLLNAVELPELITSTQAGYEALAVDLASDSERLGRILDRLARNRLTTALFDTPRFTRHLESAYLQMLERHRAGLPRAHIRVERREHSDKGGRR
jgi:predicted O-linked N-acetylglucosamine transferase (SPINDLY family)